MATVLELQTAHIRAVFAAIFPTATNVTVDMSEPEDCFVVIDMPATATDAATALHYSCNLDADANDYDFIPADNERYSFASICFPAGDYITNADDFLASLPEYTEPAPHGL